MVHVLEYKRDKGRYVILLQHERGEAATTKSLCDPASRCWLSPQP